MINKIIEKTHNFSLSSSKCLYYEVTTREISFAICHEKSEIKNDEKKRKKFNIAN